MAVVRREISGGGRSKQWQAIDCSGLPCELSGEKEEMAKHGVAM